MRRNKSLWLLAAIALALSTVGYAQSGHMKMGYTGYLTLRHDTRVGNALLPAGDYQVNHNLSVDRHFVMFTRVVRRWEGPDDYEVVADAPCTTESLGTVVKKTSAQFGSGAGGQLMSLRIRGENVVHVFPAGPQASVPQSSK